MCVGVIIAAIERRRNMRRVDRILAWLRAKDRDARLQTLSSIRPMIFQAYLRDVLERDGTEEREGDVERFPFPGSLQRRQAIIYWTSWAIAAAAFGPAAIARSIGTAGRGSLIAVGVAACGVALIARRRESRFATVLEVTPFRISELSTRGDRHTLLFSRYLELANEPKRRRAVLRPAGSPESIALDYARMGFERLAALVIAYGGLQPVATPEIAPGEPTDDLRAE